LTHYLSIAVHFNSPLACTKANDLHSDLCKTKVFVAHTITSSLHFQQDEQLIVIPASHCELHIEASYNGGFDIYIPSDEDSRDFCIASRLPHRLSGCLMNCKPSRLDPQIVSLIASIIHIKPTNISRVLQANGITELDLSLQAEDIIGIDDEPVSVPGQRALPRLEPGRPSTPVVSVDRIANGGCPPLLKANESSSLSSPFQLRQDDKYRRLLIKVVDVARSLGLPQQNSSLSINHPISTNVPGQISYWFWSDKRDQGREMIGAAGELFVSGFFLL